MSKDVLRDDVSGDESVRDLGSTVCLCAGYGWVRVAVRQVGRGASDQLMGVQVNPGEKYRIRPQKLDTGTG